MYNKDFWGQIRDYELLCPVSKDYLGNHVKLFQAKTVPHLKVMKMNRTAKLYENVYSETYICFSCRFVLLSFDGMTFFSQFFLQFWVTKTGSRS